jgi:hypothetical protein
MTGVTQKTISAAVVLSMLSGVVSPSLAGCKDDGGKWYEKVVNTMVNRQVSNFGRYKDTVVGGAKAAARGDIRGVAKAALDYTKLINDKTYFFDQVGNITPAQLRPALDRVHQAYSQSYNGVFASWEATANADITFMESYKNNPKRALEGLTPDNYFLRRLATVDWSDPQRAARQIAQ